jgi:voltage-gated potassium channel
MLLNKSIIEKVPLFIGADPNMVREVIFKLKPSIFIPGDAICTFGEIGEKMYFINKGTVEVVSPDGKQVYAILKEGDFFGEIALLLKQPRNATIRSVDYCDLYSLDKDSFDAVISNYPAFEKNIKNLAHERMRAFAN